MLDSYSNTIYSNNKPLSDHSLEIRELLTEELPKTLPLLSSFYPQLSDEILSKRLSEISGLNWKCIGVFDHGKMIGLSGYWLNTRLYCGKYLYIDHFIVDGEYRCRGTGAKLLDYLKRLAKNSCCEHVCLDTFVTNSLAQSFWSRHGFNIVGFHYIAQ